MIACSSATNLRYKPFFSFLFNSQEIAVRKSVGNSNKPSLSQPLVTSHSRIKYLT